MSFITVTEIIAASLLASSLWSASKPPSFGDFSSAGVFSGTPAAPRLQTPRDKRYRTQIREQARGPADFAGFYRIAKWGCGSECVSIAVIDLRTGSISDGPFNNLSYGAPYSYAGGSSGVEYRSSSRLLIARGCPGYRTGYGNCGTYYYEWMGGRFHQIRFRSRAAVP